MKKTLIIALAGMMMFAFTQCGGGKDGGTASASSSKQFKETKEMYEGIQKAVDEAEDCEQLQEAALTLVFGSLGVSFGDYADDEKMTEKEEAEINKLTEKISKAIENKSTKFGCDDEEE